MNKLILLFAVVAAILATGCSGKSDEPVSSTQAPPAEKPAQVPGQQPDAGTQPQDPNAVQQNPSAENTPKMAPKPPPPTGG